MTLVVLAHGTNDPAGRATWGALLTRVRELLPDTHVRLAWAGVARPQLADLLPKLPDGPVVVVPAFLASGFHVRRDVPDQLAALGRPDVRVTDPLGPDPVLVDAALERLRDAGWRDEQVVLAAAGSTDEVAQADLRVAASLVEERVGATVPVGYIAGGAPKLAEVVGAQDRPVALLTWLLAPGVFHRWAAATGATVVAEPLGDHPAVASLLGDRYRASVALAG